MVQALIRKPSVLSYLWGKKKNIPANVQPKKQNLPSLQSLQTHSSSAMQQTRGNSWATACSAANHEKHFQLFNNEGILKMNIEHFNVHIILWRHRVAPHLTSAQWNAYSSPALTNELPSILSSVWSLAKINFLKCDPCPSPLLPPLVIMEGLGLSCIGVV